jgi:hypothetical protein
MTDKTYCGSTKPKCVFCDTTATRKLMTTTDCGDICCKCVRSTHRKCCECKQYRIKTEYHHLSVYYDEDYIMCKDCFKQTHKCEDCIRPFIPDKQEFTSPSGETLVNIKSICRDCEHFNEEEYRLNHFGIAPKGMRWTKGHLSLEKC